MSSTLSGRQARTVAGLVIAFVVIWGAVSPYGIPEGFRLQLQVPADYEREADYTRTLGEQPCRVCGRPGEPVGYHQRQKALTRWYCPLHPPPERNPKPPPSFLRVVPLLVVGVLCNLGGPIYMMGAAWRQGRNTVRALAFLVGLSLLVWGTGALVLMLPRAA